MTAIEEQDYLEQLQERLAQLTQPFLDEYKDLDRKISDMERELGHMRKARTTLRQTLRNINPELVPAQTQVKGAGGKSSAPSAARVAAVAEFLQEHKEEVNANGGFNATELEATYGTRGTNVFPIAYQSGISKALHMLHAQGVIRLDHTGNYGAKFYKVV